MEPVNELCQTHLEKVVSELDPEFLIGIGAYAEKQLAEAAEAEKQLQELGIGI